MRDDTKAQYPYRVYRYNDLVLPSVTSALDHTPGKGKVLQRWAAKAVATAAANHAQVESIVDMGGRDEWIRWVAGAPYRQTGQAADRGTAVHESIAKDGLPAVAKLLLHNAGIRIAEQEITVANLPYNYAGTTDILAINQDGEPGIIDIKTGKRAYPEAVCQLAAYGRCDTRIPSGLPFPRATWAAVLHLHGGRAALYEADIGPEVFAVFMHLLKSLAWHDLAPTVLKEWSFDGD